MHRRMFLGVCGLLALVCFISPLSAQDARNVNRNRLPTVWAVLIGVDRYDHVRKLECCGKDMLALQERLRAVGFPPDHVLLLHDGAEEKQFRPFKNSIETQLDAILGEVNDKGALAKPGRAAQGDLVFVAFSGHGTHMDKASYFCPVETEINKPETLLSLERVEARLLACPAAHKLLLVDACRNELPQPGAKALLQSDRARDFSKSLETPLAGVVKMASCKAGQSSFEYPDLGHGVFMNFLLEGLDGKAVDRSSGKVTLLKLYTYALENTVQYVHAHRDDDKVEQTPTLTLPREFVDFDVGTMPNSTVVVTTLKPLAPAPRISTKETLRHGGIEVGSKGVKATVIDIIPEAGGGQRIEQKFSKTENTTIVALTKDGRFQEEAINDTAKAVETFFTQMQTDLKVTTEHIYIVGSSGLLTADSKPLAANQDDLVRAIRERTGKTMAFIDVTTEVVMSLKGGVVPPADRGSALFIDIGSGNIKCGYYEEETTTTVERFVVAKDLPYGTKTYTDAVKKDLKGKDDAQFVAAARAKRELITDPLTTSIERKPGLVNRQRVYLSGGAVWALTSLVHPERAKEKYVRLQARDIDRFYELLCKTPGSLPTIDLSKVDDPSVRKAAEVDIKRVGDTFSWQNLVAADELLRGMSETLHLEGKELLFARDGFMSWIVYYTQYSAEKKKRP